MHKDKSLAQEDLFREFMEGFGVKTEREHFRETPRRVVAMYEELLSGYGEPDFEFTTFEANETPSLVTVSNIDYYSLCSHHLMPFFGKVHISYLPDKKIVGLSKFPRTVRHFSSRLQVQEQLTEEIANYLEEMLKPKALAVMMGGRHLCMELRGVRAQCANTTTSAMRGLFLDKEEGVGLKEEFFQTLNMK